MTCAVDLQIPFLGFSWVSCHPYTLHLRESRNGLSGLLARVQGGRDVCIGQCVQAKETTYATPQKYVRGSWRRVLRERESKRQDKARMGMRDTHALKSLSVCACACSQVATIGPVHGLTWRLRGAGGRRTCNPLAARQMWAIRRIAFFVEQTGLRVPQMRRDGLTARLHTGIIERRGRCTRSVQSVWIRVASRCGVCRQR